MPIEADVARIHDQRMQVERQGRGSRQQRLHDRRLPPGALHRADPRVARSIVLVEYVNSITAQIFRGVTRCVGLAKKARRALTGMGNHHHTD